jgi:hypothetical protein
LAAPFAAEEVRTRRGPRGDLRYITARVARRRLNEVLGPANWECRIEPSECWVKCALTIILRDGRQVTREDVGGYPKMSEEEDIVKAAASDSFKRACVCFGIAEYLYGDDWTPEPAPTATQPTSTGRSTPTPTRQPQITFATAREFYH